MKPIDDAGPPDPDRGTDMTSTYLRVIAVEALIIVALWYFGRAFS